MLKKINKFKIVKIWNNKNKLKELLLQQKEEKLVFKLSVNNIKS